jgi:hypothetical protein
MSPVQSAMAEAVEVKGAETTAVLERLARGDDPATCGEWPELQAFLLKHLQYTLAYAAAALRAHNAATMPAWLAKPADERKKGRQPITDDDFAEDSAYMVERFEAWAAPAFTLPRLAEVLLSPRKHHATTEADATAALLLPAGGAGDAALRADKLQDALRKCVLVV